MEERISFDSYIQKPQFSMKKILFLFVIVFVNLSCGHSFHPVFNFSKPDLADFFEDEVLKISLGESEGCSKVNYQINNKLNKDISIDWNRASFISLEGEAFRIYEGEMKGTDSNVEQLVQTIPAKSFKKGVLVSGKNLKYMSYMGWTVDCFFDESGLDLKGKSLRLRIPIMVDGNTKEYDFEVIISDVIKRKNTVFKS